MAYHKIHEPVASDIDCVHCNRRVKLPNLILCPFLSQLAKVETRQNKLTASWLHVLKFSMVSSKILAGFVLSLGNWVIKKLNEARDKARSVRID